MKTKHVLTMVLLLFFMSTTTSLTAQNVFDTKTDFDQFMVASETLDLRTYEINLDEDIQYDFSKAPKNITENDAQENLAAFALNMIAFGAGFGFTDLETLWCLHAAYYLRFATFSNKAAYAALGVGYNYTNAEFLTVGLFDLSLRVMMLSVLSKRFQQVRAQYGVFAKYAFGTNKFEDGFKNDLTRFSFGLFVGLHILLTKQWSMMIQTDLLTVEKQTLKSDGNEITNNQTYGFINKNNLLILTLVFTLPDSKR
ncbi:hypothetical protein [Psychroserpens sp. SPM9]|uniref:hypothetical protein n=1 Tax=Psychroserpens sp. SPM9 TaxID=2975598 RepID=UPI0021A85150|nr:hypothetical protein [Psychroserpens sp. SPM9]MDG5491043.1 hypothetical protein [Psychroserpens sp. SPM9]